VELTAQVSPVGRVSFAATGHSLIGRLSPVELQSCIPGSSDITSAMCLLPRCLRASKRCQLIRSASAPGIHRRRWPGEVRGEIMTDPIRIQN
jgi:hypothetical protein